MTHSYSADLSRRSFTASGLLALMLASLFQTSARAGALNGSLKWSARQWLVQLDDFSLAMASGNSSPCQWQKDIELILGRLDLKDLLRSLDFERLATSARFPSSGEGMERLYFLDEEDRIQPLAFKPFLFTLRKGTAVVPHGHHNMATMHMVLDGSARVRHFDKLEAGPKHMLIRPAADVVAQPGAVTSVSDEHQNIHWFEAESERVFMFNIGVYPLQTGQVSDRDYVDPKAGVPVGGGVLRAPRLGRAAAYAKYGRT